MNNFPMMFHIDHTERQSRLITFFKLILVIPWFVWLYIWSIAFQLVVILGWFIIVFTAKWPQEFFRFGLQFLRFQNGLRVWMMNLTDQWPSWTGNFKESYRMQLNIEQLPRYSRAKTGFRLILMLPLSYLAYGVLLYAACFWFVGFWSIMFTGRQPRWCYEKIADAMAWTARFEAYEYLLIESYPPIKGQDSAAAAQPSLA